MRDRSVPLPLAPLAAAWLIAADPAGATDVGNCLDDGSPGSLRSVILASGANGVVNLAKLNCTIFLDSAITIPVSASPLTIQGPGSIVQGNLDRVFLQPANTKLTISKVSIGGGIVSNADAVGGCILSGHPSQLNLYDSNVSYCTVYEYGTFGPAGGCIRGDSVKLTDTTVSSCRLENKTSVELAAGGGVFASDLQLTRAVITGNAAVNLNAGGDAIGGGVYAHSITAYQSTISNNMASSARYAFGGGINANNLSMRYGSITGNTATSPYAKGTKGGGAYVYQLSGSGAYIASSTISGNHSDYTGGGLFLRVSAPKVLNSTISSNTAAYAGGLFVSSNGSAAPQPITNTTIAFNHATSKIGGMFMVFGALDVESTIIAKNSEGILNAPSDLTNSSASPATISGAANLVMAPSVPLPSGFAASSADPLLGPLQNNGGADPDPQSLGGQPGDRNGQ